MVPQLQADTYHGFCSFFSVIRKVSMVVYCTCFFPVISVFVYIYLDILKVACGHHRRIGRIRRAGSGTAEPRRPPPCFWSHAKALRTVAALVGCFLVLWCPFFVVGMVELLCSGCRLANVLQNYLWLLGLSNSIINPLVYAFWQREVRHQLAAMFSCLAGRGGRHPPSLAAPRNDRFFVPNRERGQGSHGCPQDSGGRGTGQQEGQEGHGTPVPSVSYHLHVKTP